VTSFLRDLNGNLIQAHGDFTIDNNIAPTNIYTNFYNNLNDCETDSNINPSITFSASTNNSVSYYIKFISSTSGFNFEVTPSDSSIKSVRMSTIKIQDPATSVDTSLFAGVRINSKPDIPSGPGLSPSKKDCFPVFISMTRADLIPLVLSSSSTQVIDPLKVRVADSTGPNTNGYNLFSDDKCSTPNVVFPVGSTAVAAGTDVVAPARGSSYYKLYIMPDHSSKRGVRRLEFFYDDKIIGTFKFELTDPNH
jgi:hypothetical protein